ncbi:MAG TPA: uroporphyrinogen-III C-methyltransferase [Methylophilaceae bacterium]|jgi:uroporphyrin-3 C-methyltransferase
MTNQNQPDTEIESSIQVTETENTLASTKENQKPSIFASTALVLVLVALCILVWQWLNTHQRFTQLEQTLTQRLEQYSANNQQSLALAKNADDRTAETSAHVALLEQKLAESQNQQEALQTLYLELANNREERVIAEVEQLMIIANQQLQLAGNVKPALLALQTADSRLQELDTPQVIQLRKAVAQDIQHLQSLPSIDVVGMSLKLESLSENIDSLPLVSERHPSPAIAPKPDWNSNPWHRLAQEVWQDLKQMIRIERIDRPEPPLLAPDQTFFLRENIKLHLLTARIALLQHDEATYRTDLEAAEKWLKGHFDLREAATISALATIKELSANNIVIDLPDISESLGLVSKYKLSLERNGSQEHSPGRHK